MREKGGRGLNLTLLVVVTLTIGLNWLLEPDRSRPNFEFLPEMAHSPAYSSYSMNSLFEDGKTLREPVPETIPRGRLPLHFTAGEEQAIRAGRELEAPDRTETPELLEKGASLFKSFCSHCHGQDARGNGPVVQRGVPAPPSLLRDETRRLQDGELFHILSFGKGNMSDHAGELSRKERWTVIHYLRTLQANSDQTR